MEKINKIDKIINHINIPDPTIKSCYFCKDAEINGWHHASINCPHCGRQVIQ